MSGVFRKANYHLVKNKVEEVIKDNFIANPPIDIRNLVQNYGLQITFALFNNHNISGFLDISGKSIWVNANDAPTRQNFTIAHEFGHWLLHKEEIEADPKSYKVLFRQPLGLNTDYREKEANAFAANLLVPTKMLKICRIAKFNSMQMSVLFDVSEDVINYRLLQEGLND